jgi:adenosylhomocysteine nucleosidase
MPKLAIIAALPRELALLARDLRATRISDRNGILLETASIPGADTAILLVTAGMGSNRAALAVAATLAHGPVHTLLSVGLAGACDPTLTPATVLEATLVIDTNSGERFETNALPETTPAILVTTPHIAGPAEKQRLHATYNAAIVDMEAATVARLAHAHNIPFRAFKAISDEHTVDLTHLSHFADSRGHFRTGAFALHTALRPHRWRATAALGKNSNLALQALTTTIHRLIALHTKTSPI